MHVSFYNRLIILGIMVFVTIGQMKIGLCTSSTDEIHVNIGLPTNFSPFINQETASGIEYEILKKIFDNLQINYSFFYMSPKRLEWSFKKNIISTSAHNYFEDKSAENIYFSDSVIKSKMLALTLTSRNINIEDMHETKKLKIASLQQFPVHFQEFKQISQNSYSFVEYLKPTQLIRALLNKSVDLIFIDKNIYDYNRAIMIEVKGINDIKEIKNFNPIDYRVTFKDKSLRDRFNYELLKLKKNNFIKNINLSYFGEYLK